MLFCSCSSKKFLTDGEFLIKKNHLEIEAANLSSVDKDRLEEELFYTIPLKPNSKSFIFFPKERSALKYRMAADTPNITALLMKLDGETPSLVDTIRIEAINFNLQNELKAKGYYDATGTVDVKYKKKTATVHYNLKANKPYVLKRFEYNCPDPEILRLLRKDSVKTKLRPGELVSAQLLASEMTRIVEKLRNQGYYGISRTNFPIPIIDTIDHKVDMVFTLLPDNDSQKFTKYRIGDVNIYPGFQTEHPLSAYRGNIIDNYNFYTLDSNTIIRPRFMIDKIEFTTGEIYSYSKHRQTIRGLSSLSTFRYPRINITKNTVDSAALDYNIRLIKNKNIFDLLTVDGFISNIETKSDNGSTNSVYLGLNLGASRSINNVFGGSEQLTVNLDGSFETVVKGIDQGDLIQIGTGLNLRTPRYRNNTGFTGLINLIPIKKWLNIDSTFVHDLKRYGATSYRIRADYEENQLLYKTTNINISVGDVRLNRNNKQYDFVFSELQYFKPTKLLLFDSIFRGNEFFQRSFEEQFITGVFFRSLRYQSDSPFKNNFRTSIDLDLEVSGLEVFLYQNGKNWLGGKDIRIPDTGQIGFSQYIKAEIDYKPSYRINQRITIATRFNAGIALAYAKYKSIPIATQFSVGGPNSLRGWIYREVGPGNEQNNQTVTPFSTGDLLLQGSVELRGDLFWLLEGAFFVDFGNVWTKENMNGFIDQIAVDYGIGIRLDLTYFLLRFDVGVPLRYWYKPDGQNNHINKGALRFKEYQTNFGINYPF